MSDDVAMDRFRVLASSGAIYGDFSDYELALGQAEHLTSSRRRHKQSATVQIREGESWRDVITFTPGGALASSTTPPNATMSLLRPSALAR